MVTVDRITRDDLCELAKLYEELIGKPTDLERMFESFEKIEKSSEYILIGAKDEKGNLLGSILGVICFDVLGECRPFMVIDNVIVKNGFRGLGVGRKLINYMEAVARTRNCYSIMLVSSFRRKEAHEFYEAVGYANDFVRGFKKYL
jgi:predicted N-acetyltransferase YhbS